MFVYNILIMETPITDNKGKLIVIPNPDLDNNWLERFKNNWKELEHTPFIFGTAGEVDTCNGKDLDFFFEYFIKKNNVKLKDYHGNENKYFFLVYKEDIEYGIVKVDK